MDGLNVDLIIYATLLVIFFGNHSKSRIIPLAPMVNKEANEKTDTTMKNEKKITWKRLKHISLQL